MESQYDADEKTRFYPTCINKVKRNGDEFYGTIPEQGHIKEKYPLLKLGIDLIAKFVLDPMHLIYLGVVKRLLVHYWVYGKRLQNFKNVNV